MANDGGVACILHDRVLRLSGSAVMGEQCEQEGAQHAALGSSSVEHEPRGGVTAIQTVWGLFVRKSIISY